MKDENADHHVGEIRRVSLQTRRPQSESIYARSGRAELTFNAGGAVSRDGGRRPECRHRPHIYVQAAFEGIPQ